MLIKRQHCVLPAEPFDSALGTLSAAVQVVGNFFFAKRRPNDNILSCRD